MKSKRASRAALAVILCVALASFPGGRRGQAQSLPDAIEAIARARVATRILYVTAHPDDEYSGILTYLARGLHADTALLSVTRGEGGQNAIGPEQAPELGILRTQELLAASRGYGVKLFFTRAPDFGYSKTADETLKIWKDVALDDMVRTLRTFRPDIVINEWGGVHTGHGQHQATGILLPQAVEKAADQQAFPDQWQEGLRPWKVSQILQISRGDAAPEKGWRVPVNDISPVWGRTYSEIGLEAFSHHRSQGITQFVGSPFFRRPVYLVPTDAETIKPETLDEPITSIASLAPDAKSELEDPLKRADVDLQNALDLALSLHWGDAAKTIAAAGKEIAGAQASLCGRVSPPSNAEVCWAIQRERSKIDEALADAAALSLEARAAQSELVPGEAVDVSIRQQYRPEAGLKTRLVELRIPPAWTVQRKTSKDSPADSEEFSVNIPANATGPASSGDAILPEPPPLIIARLSAEIDGYAFIFEQPVISLRASSTSAELVPLVLMPAVTLTVEPKEWMVPASKLTEPARPMALLARVRYHGKMAAEVTTGLEAPSGWKVTPVAPLSFSGPGDQLVQFEISPPANVAAGAYSLHPFAQLAGQTFRTSVEPLPTLPTRLFSEPAEANVHILNLTIPAGLRIGYVAADNDLVPDDLRQLGIRVDLLDDAQLAFGSLSQYDAIAVGIRAYELRPELVRANARLLEYVRAGGTLVVQYQRDFAWNKSKLAPFPASMPSVTSRTTDENSPVAFLQPESSVLNFPNRITQDDFKGWVQERGLYYWGEFDPRYQPILSFTDPGEDPARGALVYAKDGKGVYIYTGIAFFRQLPAGVPGAYRLFVNLLSQSRAPKRVTNKP
jgi:LmbE family N-acetylglucosaminyl deacetylase